MIYSANYMTKSGAHGEPMTSENLDELRQEVFNAMYGECEEREPAYYVIFVKSDFNLIEMGVWTENAEGRYKLDVKTYE